MYKVDSNGERRQKLSDEDCYRISYFDGWIYYSTRGENEGAIFCMKPDGTGNTRLSPKLGSSLITEMCFYRNGELIPEDDEQNKRYLFFLGYDPDTDVQDLYRVSHENGGTQVKKIAENVLNTPVLQAEKGGKSWLYFQDDRLLKQNDYTGSSPVYRTDGDVIEKVTDTPVAYFSFCLNKDGDVLVRVQRGYEYDDDGSVKPTPEYMADLNFKPLDGENNLPPDSDLTIIKITGTYSYVDGFSEVYSNSSEDGKYEILEMADYVSDDKYSVYSYHFLDNSDYYYNELYFEDRSGKRTDIEDCRSEYYLMRSENDKLYYINTNRNLVCMDMASGELKTIAENMSYSSFADIRPSVNPNTSFGFVSDNNGNLFKLNLADGTLSEVYPNSNRLRYGEVYGFSVKRQDKTLTKIDTEGNICDILTGVDVYNAVYVPNGFHSGISAVNYRSEFSNYGAKTLEELGMRMNEDRLPVYGNDAGKGDE